MLHKWRATPRDWNRSKERAREFRKDATVAEKVLWQSLRDRRLEGRKFRRQHAIDRFIVDFYCRDASLVVELDGDVHAQLVERDAERAEILMRAGLTVIRFTNDEVLTALDDVLDRIRRYLIANGRTQRR
jgi:very-short-patch-repair endonuclease